MPKKDVTFKCKSRIFLFWCTFIRAFSLLLNHCPCPLWMETRFNVFFTYAHVSWCWEAEGSGHDRNQVNHQCCTLPCCIIANISGDLLQLQLQFNVKAAVLCPCPGLHSESRHPWLCPCWRTVSRRVSWFQRGDGCLRRRPPYTPGCAASFRTDTL